MVRKWMIGASVLLLCAASLTLARARVSLSIDRDSISIETDTTGTDTSLAWLRAQRSLPSGHPLAGIPPEAWAKMSSDQIQELAEQALKHRDREFPRSSVWERVEIIVPIVATVSSCAALVLIVFFVVRYKRSRSQQIHEEQLAMIDKGIDPKQLLGPPKLPWIQRMMIWGYILSLGGAGWTVMNLANIALARGGPHREIDGIGPVLALIGVGLILAARYLEKEKRAKEGEPGTCNRRT